MMKHKKVRKDRNPKHIIKKHLLVLTAATPKIPTRMVDKVRAKRA